MIRGDGGANSLLRAGGFSGKRGLIFLYSNDLRTQEATIGGKKQAISTGLGDEYNTDLHAVGATYGVKKLFTDRPHWSATGG